MSLSHALTSQIPFDTNHCLMQQRHIELDSSPYLQKLSTLMIKKILIILTLVLLPNISFGQKYTGSEACSLLSMFLKMDQKIKVDCGYLYLKEMRGSTYFIKIHSTPHEGAMTVGAIIGALETVDRKVPTKTAGVLIYNDKAKMAFSMPVVRKCMKISDNARKGMCLLMAATPID
jgi:hypothetical protein